MALLFKLVHMKAQYAHPSNETADILSAAACAFFLLNARFRR